MSKTATIPAIRVAPELRDAAQRNLMQGETLSSFVEKAIRAQVEKREVQAEFLKRALISRDKALKTGVYYSAESVQNELSNMLNNAIKASHS